MASWLLFGFWTITGLAIVFAAVLTKFQAHLPQAFIDLIFYGKVRGNRTKWSVIQLLEIPKSWFTYFYLLGAFINGGAVLMISDAYLNHRPLPQIVQQILAFVASNKETSTDALSAILLVGMMFTQNVRRLLECVFISVYSKSTMNIIHFMLGVILYSTFFIAVLVEAPATTSGNVHLNVRWYHVCGLLLFLWASYHHHEAHVVFANLRKNNTGAVVNYEHAIPRGGWFEYVSCPHFFMEILIYLAFMVVAGFCHKTLLGVFVFVLSNQLVAGHLTHCWNKQQFKSYPPNRRAVLPYLF